MKQKFLLNIFFLFVALSLSFHAFCQGGNFIKRLEIGYNFLGQKVTHIQRDTEIEKDGHSVIYDNMERSYKASKTSGLVLGMAFQLADLGNSSGLMFPIAFNYNSLEYRFDKYEFNYAGERVTYAPIFKTSQISMQLGLDIRRGPDVSLECSEKIMYGIGVGFEPIMVNSSFVNFDKQFFDVRSYLKAEAGVNFGVAIKLKAVWSAGRLNYMTDLETINTQNELALKTNSSLFSKSQLTISLCLMPLSTSWRGHKWYQ